MAWFLQMQDSCQPDSMQESCQLQSVTIKLFTTYKKYGKIPRVGVGITSRQKLARLLHDARFVPTWFYARIMPTYFVTIWLFTTPKKYGMIPRVGVGLTLIYCWHDYCMLQNPCQVLITKLIQKMLQKGVDKRECAWYTKSKGCANFLAWIIKNQNSCQFFLLATKKALRPFLLWFTYSN